MNDRLSLATPRRLVLDLETIGGSGIADLLDPVDAPSNYRDPLKIAAYIEDKGREQIEKAATEPDLCEVVAVGLWREGASESVVLTRETNSEIALLQYVWASLGDDGVTVGFNSLAFDLPVLIRRSQLLGLPSPELNLDRYRSPHVDLLERLSFHGRIRSRSLGFYARRFGVTSSIVDPYTGADVAHLVATNNWTALANHTRSDLELTAKLAAKLGWWTLAPTPAGESQDDLVF